MIDAKDLLVTKRLNQAVREMIRARFIPRTENRRDLATYALIQLALRYYAWEDAGRPESPSDKRLVVILEAQDLLAKTRHNQDIGLKFRELARSARTDYERSKVLAWGQAAVRSIDDPYYRRELERDIEWLNGLMTGRSDGQDNDA